MNPKKVFISYCWSNPDHEEWVINLAERLMSDGIDVIIDKWYLKEGNDKYDFMESMVKSPEISKVLIILDKKYAEKADSRKGGVGTETQIISSKVYKDVSQEKFIPIVSERDAEGNAFLPTYLEGRIFIDLSNNDAFEENYETLLRNLYARPAYSKPKLGRPPSFLFEDTPITFKTSSIVRGLDQIIEKHPERLSYTLRDFLEEFYINLKQFKIEIETREVYDFGKKICENIIQYTPLRNDYLIFIDKLTKNGVQYDEDLLVNFFEDLTQLNTPEDNTTSWTDHLFDNFRFIIYEIFLYTITIGLRNENYKFVHNMLYSSYFTKDRYDNPRNEAKTYSAFYCYLEIIKHYYKETYSKDYFSPGADLLITRIPEGLTKKHIVQADLLCYYAGVLSDIRWFPQTYVYDTSGRFELFYKMVSMKHFEKVKSLFGVNTLIELKTKLIEIRNNDKGTDRIGYAGSFEWVQPIYNIINPDTLGSKN